MTKAIACSTLQTLGKQGLLDILDQDIKESSTLFSFKRALKETDMFEVT